MIRSAYANGVSFAKASILAALLATVAALAAHGEKSTVCTVTVNSADERDAFRRYLPEDKFEFVELVERGRPDWLRSACSQGIRCDVLIVSGHFAGTEFYSSSLDADESLPVDEMQRVQCSASCPGLFSQLKEVYLFGCDTLKPEPVKSATPEIVRGLVRAGQSRAQAERLARGLSERHAEASRELMRGIFANVPVIYGFSSLAPYGRVSGPMLAAYFESGADEEIGSGIASEKLLRLFGPASMTVASGLRDSDPNADYRRQSCRYFDDRVPVARKTALMHETLHAGGTEARMSFDRIEKFFASLGESERREPALSAALGALAQDRTARKRYLALVHDTEDPALRARMIALARKLGWLSPAVQRDETVRMILEVLARESMGYAEVDLICALNEDRGLDRELHRLKAARLPAEDTGYAAARACLGSAEGRSRMLRALASREDQDVQLAQAYLRHRPITDASELRAASRSVARMSATAPQVRALETLARHHISDREILDDLTRLYTQATSPAVQRAIAEVFLRADYRVISTRGLVAILRQYRLESADGEDLIDLLITRLETSPPM
jgi:hypothetical protein